MSRSIPRDELVARLVEVAGSRYTFRISGEFRGTTSQFTCTCLECSHTWVAPYIRLFYKRHGCPRCAGILSVSEQDALTQLTVRYGNKYTIEMPNGYKNQNTIVLFTCKTCGYQWQRSFGGAIGKTGTGCKQCSQRLKPTLFIARQKLELVSQGRYTFELTEYKNTKQKVKCKCNTCGYEWHNRYENLTKRGDGCRVCFFKGLSESMTLTQSEAESRLNSVGAKKHFTWRFKNGTYESVRTRVMCKCNVCGGEWESNFSAITSNSTGCKRCSQSESQRFTYGQVASMLNGVSQGHYTFSIVGEYRNARTSVECQCSKCGLLWTTTFHDLYYNKSGCPNLCYKAPSYKSTPEHEIVDYINQNFPQLEIQQSVRNLIRNPTGSHFMEIDIYIPELHLAFEFNGTYWHSDKVVTKKKRGFTSAQQYHDYKTEQCAQKGVKLVHIDEQRYKRSSECVLQDIQLQIQEQVTNG